MSKKKIVSWLLSLCLLGGLVAMPGVAGASGTEPEPEMTVAWDDTEDKDNWVVNMKTGEAGGYLLKLVDDKGNEIRAMSNGSATADTTLETDVSSRIVESGTYTAVFTWYGPDGNSNTVADNKEVRSDPKVYQKPAAFGTPAGVKWEGTKAVWQVASSGTVPQANADAEYIVKAYRVDAKDIPTFRGVITQAMRNESYVNYVQSVAQFRAEGGLDFDSDVAFGDIIEEQWGDSGSTAEENFPGSAYVFTVRVESKKIGTNAHSAESAPSPMRLKDGTPVGGGTTPPPIPVPPAAPVDVAWEAGEDVWTIGFTPKANVQHTLKLYDSANPTTALQTKTVSGVTDTKVTWDVAAFVQLPANDGKSFLVGVTAIGTSNSAEVKSALKKYTDPVTQIVEDIDNIAIDPDDPDAALTALESAGDVEELYEAMQKDADVAAKIEDIETAYIAKNTNTTPVYDVDASLADIVGTNADVSAVGLALNAINTTASVMLSIDPVAEQDEETVGLTGYENVLQLAISLTGNVQTTLTVPVRITMPIPEGVSEQNLVILHYTTPGSAPEVIVPDSIAGGKVTFTVTSFSTFAFANKARQSGPSYDHDWSQDLPAVAPPPQEWKPGSPSLTAPVPSAPSTNFYRVLARSLNQRGGPGTNYPIMGKLSQNALIQIVGFSEDGQWAQTSAGTWLSMAYLSGTNAASGTGNYVVSVSSSLNVRSGPGTGSSTIGKLYAGASVRALSVENGWAMIEYNGGTAYVSAMYLR